MPFFIEVGSCDFDTCETIIQNGWRGIVIEPVKYYFDKLHKYPNIYYENIAISNHNGESEIYYINPNDIKTNDQEWMKHTLAWLKDGKVEIDYKEVHAYTLSTDVPPKARVY